MIIADDLTGANATGVLLARNGYRTGTFLSLDQITKELFDSYEVISLTTDSRALAMQDARSRVQVSAKAMAQFGVDLFSKRIDSTLRGNLGAEIDAILDVLGPETIAVVVAAFPSSGRITVGGYLMVNSVPLEKTFAAKDPKTPVDKSIVSEIIAQQSKYQIGLIRLETVLQGADRIGHELTDLVKEGKRIIVVDAATQEDLNNIALGVRQTGINAVAVDPGPFTEAMARHLLPEPCRHPGKKVLMVVGSVTPLVREQLKDVELNFDSHFIYADAKTLIGDNADSEIDRVCTEVLSKVNDFQILGVRTIKSEGDILNIEDIAEAIQMDVDQVSEKISSGLAKIARKVLDRSSSIFGALYTSGGDTTVAVCHEVGAAGIEVKDEVIPLAAYGRIIGGPYDNTPIITKGGLVGENNAVSTCIDYLLTKISNEYHGC